MKMEHMQEQREQSKDQSQLADFVTKRLAAGETPEAIKQKLLLVGWDEGDACAAVVAGLLSSGVPQPNNKKHIGRMTLSSTVEVVLNLFSFILLTTVAVSLGVLLYQLIGKYFPDPLMMQSGSLDYASSTMHYAIAALLIAFPVYATSVYQWFKRFRDNEEKVESALTKWVTYLVLLIAAVTIVGDLITAVFYFLQGEMSERFLLKALSIMLIAGIVFGFYVLERLKIQYKQNITRATLQYAGVGVGIIIAFFIVLGLFAGGTPKEERNRGFDATRTNDLRQLASCVSSYGTEHKRLPATIAELSVAAQYYCAGSVVDPETLIPYDYRIVLPDSAVGAVHEGRFELCATFALSSLAVDGKTMPLDGDKWGTHAAGRVCTAESVVLDRGESPPSALPVKSI